MHPACPPALRRISEQTLASSRRVKDLVSASCVRSLGRTQHYHGRGQKLSRPLWHSWPSTGVAVSSTGAWTAAMCGCRARAPGSSCTRRVSRPAGHPRLPPRTRRAAMATHSKTRNRVQRLRRLARKIRAREIQRARQSTTGTAADGKPPSTGRLEQA